MAIKIWRPTAAPRAQISTVQVTSYDAATTYSLIIAGFSVTAIAAGSANATATALAAAWNASVNPILSGITASANTDTVTLTADVAGVPFTVTSDDSGGTGTIGAVATGTTATSRHNIGDANNWFDVAAGTYGSLPANDDVVIYQGPYAARWGLDQSSVAPAAVYMMPGFAGAGLDPHRLATSPCGKPQRQVARFQITTFDATSYYQVSRDGNIARVLGDTDIPTTVAALVAAWNGSAHPAFEAQTAFLSESQPDQIDTAHAGRKRPGAHGITAYANGDYIDLIADSPDLAFEISASVTGGSGAVGSVAYLHRDDAGEYRATRIKYGAKDWYINPGVRPGGAAAGGIRIHMHTTASAGCSVFESGSGGVDVIGGASTQNVWIQSCSGGCDIGWGTGETCTLEEIRVGGMAAAGSLVRVGPGVTFTVFSAASGEADIWNASASSNVVATGSARVSTNGAVALARVGAEEGSVIYPCNGVFADASAAIAELHAERGGTIDSMRLPRERTWTLARFVAPFTFRQNLERPADGSTAPQFRGVAADNLEITTLKYPRSME